MQGPPFALHLFWKKETFAHLKSAKPADQSMRRFVGLSPRDGMAKHGMRIHHKEILSRTPLDMFERTMKSLLVQWVSAWWKETRTAQQIVGLTEQDAHALSFNQHVMEPAGEASDHEPEQEASAAPEAPVAPAAPQRSPVCRQGARGVICLCLGACRKPIFLVLHLKIKLFPMFSITIDLVGKYRTQATARRRRS